MKTKKQPLNLGWKTLAGTALVAVGQIVPALWPPSVPFAPYITGTGFALGGYGLRSAIANIGGSK